MSGNDMKLQSLETMARWIFAVVLLTSLTACGDKAPSPPQSPGVQQVQAAVATGLPTIAEFGASMCASCIEMKQVLANVADRTKARANVLIVDISKDWAVAQKYGIQVMPTQVFFAADGHELKRHIGKMTEAEVVDGLGLGDVKK